MSRTATIALAFLLLFLGVKLRLVQSYQLTPAATKFWNERIEDPEVLAKYNLQQQASPSNRFNPGYLQASYANMTSTNLMTQQKIVTPPPWVCWPVFFLGAFLLLNGLSMAKD